MILSPKWQPCGTGCVEKLKHIQHWDLLKVISELEMLQIHTNSATFFPGGQLIHKTSNSCNRVSPKHTQQFFPPKNSLQQLYWTTRSQEPFPCTPPKQKKTKQPKNHNKLPTPPKKMFFFLSLQLDAMCFAGRCCPSWQLCLGFLGLVWSSSWRGGQIPYDLPRFLGSW